MFFDFYVIIDGVIR